MLQRYGSGRDNTGKRGKNGKMVRVPQGTPRPLPGLEDGLETWPASSPRQHPPHLEVVQEDENCSKEMKGKEKKKIK